jgi:NADPH:quinone reductase-like Zn-dependent oxidoreductase
MRGSVAQPYACCCAAEPVLSWIGKSPGAGETSQVPATTIKHLGADAVIVSTDGPIDQQVRAIVAEGVRYAIAPVVGETSTQMFQTFGEEGRMLVYGSLIGEPIRAGARSALHSCGPPNPPTSVRRCARLSARGVRRHRRRDRKGDGPVAGDCSGVRQVPPLRVRALTYRPRC